MAGLPDSEQREQPPGLDFQQQHLQRLFHQLLFITLQLVKNGVHVIQKHFEALDFLAGLVIELGEVGEADW